ncbi:DUF4142 domain-containing protein [Marinimicrococcus flavescens]|uniref:DUF4142 domain-containing protein n=1 Tax=Marinimicrococcus flavescens TaxID=3031815 RepID=A0AAP3UXY3_9PROT|nr:DUF4142 domain-containing protein [Marinimicrococcus flavescens]
MALTAGIAASTLAAGPYDDAEWRFLDEVADPNWFVVESGRAVLDRLEHDSRLGQLAQHMMEEHREIYVTLAELGEEVDVPVSKELDQRFAETMTGLESLEREDDFTRAWLDVQVEVHREIIEAFERHAGEAGASPKTRDIIGDYLPHLREHLARVEALRGRT